MLFTSVVICQSYFFGFRFENLPDWDVLVSGPLLPPNKYIRDVSYSYRSKLTMDLCGKLSST